MNKKMKTGIGLLLAASCLSGCKSGSAEPLTAKFQTEMEAKGLSVQDQTDSAADSTYQSISVALAEEKYSFEYYFMDSPESAETVYQYAVSNLETTYPDKEAVEVKEKKKEGYADYSISAPDYYCRVLEKENTVLYVTAYRDYEKEAKELISDLGY